MDNQRLVITNTNYLDTDNLTYHEGQTIVMENGQFTWIGDEGSFEREDGDHLISGEGKFIIPGLMDLHVHLNYEQDMLQRRGQFMLRRKDEYMDYLAMKHAQQYLRLGVTTVRGCGGRTAQASLRQLIEEKKILGPRLKLALETIVQPGNQEYFGPEPIIQYTKDKEVISGRDGIIHAVRRRKSDGADHIKTTTTGGVVHGKTSDVNQSLWRDEELEAMVDEAERIGMYVAAHAHATAGIYNAVHAGVRTIEHSTILDEDTVNLMLDRGTYIVPTLSAGTYIYHAPEEFRKGLPPEVIDKWEQVSSKMIESHQLAYEKGVPLAVGTDAPVAGPHAHTDDELMLMHKELGMSAVEVLQAATLISARAIKMDDQLGSISEGKFADLVMLNTDPTQDLAVMQDSTQLELVVKEGREVARQGRIIH